MVTQRTINQFFIVLLVCVFAGLDSPRGGNCAEQARGLGSIYGPRKQLVDIWAPYPQVPQGDKRGRTFC